MMYHIRLYYYKPKKRFCQELKEVFFINIGKKIARVFGWIVAAALLVVFVVLIVFAFGFGSGEVVKVFGYNLYIAKTGEFDSVQQGSAVVVKSCMPYDLEENNLILYNSENGAVLAYTDDIKMVDGSYVISVSDNRTSTDIAGEALIGKAESSSLFWGNLITFSLTPMGVLVMAVLPCVVLVLVDLIITAYSRRPLPEVEPQFKNTDTPAPASSLSVNEDGKASYSRTANRKPASAADSVLFTYTAKQKPAPAAKPDIIPLTDRPQKPEEAKPAEHSEPKQEKPAETDALGKTPASVAARRYMDSTIKAESSGDTAELPTLPKKNTRNDAFFTQSDAPQIGKQKPSRSVIDLEDALASAGKRGSQQYSGKRSSAILAGKKPSELIGDDDSPSDSSRYAVDDILAGLDAHKKS